MLSDEEIIADESDPESEVEPGPVRAAGTAAGSNRFKLPLFLRVLPNHTIRPVDRRDQAHYTVVLEFEYPTYEEELAAKQEALRYDEFHSVHYIDQDHLSEWRVRRCLVRWNMHKVVPGFTKRLHRVKGQLEDDSWVVFKTLPPLVRKAVILKLWNVLGPA